MTFELDPAVWEREAALLDALADALPVPSGTNLPDDRYARALGEVPALSDAAARHAHRAAVAELTGLAERIRATARGASGADEAGARAIEAVR